MTPEEQISIEAQKLLPGVVGSLGALLWIAAPWPKKIAMVLLGSATSYYGSAYVSTNFGTGEGWAGFLLGLFGMSVVDSAFKAWHELGFGSLLRDALRSKLGLPPKE